MRSRIKVNGLWYRPVPWIEAEKCTGCALDSHLCINTEARGDPCDAGCEFEAHIFIPNTKEAYEKYLAQQVLHKFDNAG